MSPDQDEAILIRFEEALTASALSPSTIVNYLADLRAFLRWGQAEMGETFSLLNVTQEHVRLYRHHLVQELERAASTVNRHIMALRKFFLYASQIAAVPLDPTAGVSLVQDDGQAISRPLTDAEIDKLLAAAQRGSRAGLIRRDVAIIQLILHTGLRVSEIVDLKKDDLVFDNPGMHLKVGNGQNESGARCLPLTSSVVRILNGYLQMRPQATNTDYLFLSQGGRSISGRTVQRIVRDCAKSAGLEGVSAQSLRRTFALRLLAKCDNLELVSERLGHQTKTITEQYLGIHKQ